jgi:PAS domain S-box-containing protein
LAKRRDEFHLPTGLIPDQLEIITRSGTAAFATDESGCITIWNHGAEELLGYPAVRVLGKSCSEILCGVDIFGNRFCDHQCPLTHMVERAEPVHQFELDVRAESGEKIPVRFSIVVIPGARARQYTMIHFMEKVDRQSEVSALVHRILTEEHTQPVSQVEARTPSPPARQLTSREIEVLRLLAEGTSTQDIAASLFISVPTTRNHVQSILRKLDVHSKLEAVSLALRTHLL